MQSIQEGAISAPSLFPSALRLSEPTSQSAGSVAIIMRTKNRPMLLHRALGSVLCQGYKKWRLYIVNDGGDRAALDTLLIDYVGAFSDRLTVIHHPKSLGMENASNAALSRAQEEFVVVHDDDDSWHPDFLRETVQFLSDPDNRLFVGVTTGCNLIHEVIKGGEVQEVHRSHWQHNRGLIDLSEMLKSNNFPPICLLFRRAAVERIGQFNGALPVLGDWEFNIRLMMVGDIDHITGRLANYHHRPKSSGSYSNTVVDGHALHERQGVLLRNSLLRLAFLERPGEIGLAQAILTAIKSPSGHPASSDYRIDELHRKIDTLAEHVREIRLVASWQRKMLRPFYRIWSTVLPLRRRIALMRGRG